MQVSLEFYGKDEKLFQKFDLKVKMDKLTTLNDEDVFAAPSIPAGILKFKLNNQEYTFPVDLPMVKTPLKTVGNLHGITLVGIDTPRVSTIVYMNERTLTWGLEDNKELVINFERFSPDPSVDYVGNQLCVYLFASMMIRSK